MFNFTHILLICGLIFLSPAHSKFAGESVPNDFTTLLNNPILPPQSGESFATHVMRPFLKSQTQDMFFFSNPKESRSQWDLQYKDWKKESAPLGALYVFETMATSRREIISFSLYRNLSNAQTQGMLGIIRGDLGYQNRSCTKKEESFLAQELLDIGHSVSRDELAIELAELETAYKRETNIARKQHLQISALLMLQGAQSQIDRAAWYLDELQNRDAILEKVYGYYAKHFLDDQALLAQESYEQLVRIAHAKDWSNVAKWFDVNKLHAPSNAKQHSVIEAIRRLNHHQQHPNHDFTEALQDQDRQALNLAAFRLPSKASPLISPEVKIEEYLSKSPILNLYGGTEKEEISLVLKESLSDTVKRNGNKWPGKEQLKVAEQFFWNLYGINTSQDELNEYIKLLFDAKFLSHPRSWQDFQSFCEPYLVEMDAQNRQYSMKRILPIYQAFPNEKERTRFLAFCEPHLVGADAQLKLFRMKELLPIYQAFPNEEEIKPFLRFCKSYPEGAFSDQASPELMQKLLPIYQAFPNEEEIKPFLKFCNSYLEGVVLGQASPELMQKLLPIYLKSPNEQTGRSFQDFCRPYLQKFQHRNYEEIKPLIVGSLLPIYLAFSNEEDRINFLKFSNNYLGEPKGNGEEELVRLHSLSDLLSVYLAFPNDQARGPFLNFCSNRVKKLDPYYRVEHMKNFLPIYQALPSEKRADFIRFCNIYLDGTDGKELDVLRSISNWERESYLQRKLLTLNSYIQGFLPIYLALSNEEDRINFLKFSNNYLEKKDPSARTQYKGILFSIYQLFPSKKDRTDFLKTLKDYSKSKKDPTPEPRTTETLVSIHQAGQHEVFEKFIRPYLEREGAGIQQRNIEKIVFSYIPRAYLRYMRVEGALKSEQNPNTSHVQSMYETDINNQLPIVWAQDRLLQRAREMGDRFAANAHDFDAVYELDRPILWRETAEYNSALSATPHTIHNNSAQTPNYHTNAEVEDFIQYLDSTIATVTGIKIGKTHLNGPKVVSIIKQMLGLEPKSGNTTGGFLPYLSSSMYYAKPESPKGDEMLGRTWFYMKNLPGNERDKEDYKKSVVLALLEAAEISQASVDTHCQTRTTGELMKLVALNDLPDSKLRPLIAATDLPPVQDDTDIQDRITAAPIRAQQLFNNIKREDNGAIRRLIERHIDEGTEPELWERYEAYYNDLYRRTQAEDGNGYKNDEHILIRDDHGNLVSRFNTNGTVRPQPITVYYQSEFQVLEQTFTELMRKEFEEQRGLKY